MRIKDAEFRRLQTNAGLPHMKILLHWDNRRYDKLTDPLPPNVYLQGVLAGGLVEVYRTRREPVPTLPLPQRVLYFLGFAGLGIGGVLLLTYLLPLTLLVATVFVAVITPIGMIREVLRQRRQ